MNRREQSSETPTPQLGRRELLAYTGAFGASFLAGQGLLSAADAAPVEETEKSAAPAGKQYEMLKSINMWAFPYPDKWSLRECFELAKDAGFDGIEINFALKGEFSDEATTKQIEEVGRLAKKVGIKISGVCSFLYWPYSLTHQDPARRAKGMLLARKMIAAARAVGTENLLCIPGAVYVPWLEDQPPVPNDVCYRRSKESWSKLLPEAEKAGVYLNMENIFANGFLFSPQEMADYADSYGSEHVKVHFDTGNIMLYQFPEHWIPILGKRIKNIHFKEWDKRQGEFNLNTFRPLLDGTTNWPAVMAALDKVGYRGYLTFEYFHPFNHWPEALVYQTSDALDRMLGRKG